MGNQASPLESLASYGIAFVAGAISFAAVVAYGQVMRRRGARETVPPASRGELMSQQSAIE